MKYAQVNMEARKLAALYLLQSDSEILENRNRLL
ncbi:hypothetical protein BV455_03617 [Parageobacillus caldoxylosilyticus]|nr:hypothetical protein BV455_03617 [Parageobacillus caldoxylosilyticus]